MDDARGDEEADAAEAWQDVTTGFVDLGTRLRTFFEGAPDTETGDEMRTAWAGFSEAAKGLSVSVTAAFQDSEVQESAKNAFGTLVDAIGMSVRQAGDHFQRDSDEDGGSEEEASSEEQAPPKDDPNGSE